MTIGPKCSADEAKSVIPKDIELDPRVTCYSAVNTCKGARGLSFVCAPWLLDGRASSAMGGLSHGT